MFRRYPDSEVHGANMGPTWVLSAPDGPHFGPMNLTIGVLICHFLHSVAINDFFCWSKVIKMSPKTFIKFHSTLSLKSLIRGLGDIQPIWKMPWSVTNCFMCICRNADQGCDTFKQFSLHVAQQNYLCLFIIEPKLYRKPASCVIRYKQIIYHTIWIKRLSISPQILIYC